MEGKTICYERYMRAKGLSRQWVVGTGLDQGIGRDIAIRVHHPFKRGMCDGCGKHSICIESKLGDAYKQRCHECSGKAYDAYRKDRPWLPERAPAEEMEVPLKGEDWWF